MILLTGATGNNGAETARQLVRLGVKVRAMALHPDKGRTEAPAELEIMPGNLDPAGDVRRRPARGRGSGVPALAGRRAAFA